MKPRTATEADLPALLELEAEFPGDRISRRGLRRLLRAPSARVRVIGTPGTMDAALILLSRRGTRVARIYSLVVAPPGRGRGLAQALVRDAEQHAGARGLTRLRLEVRADNHPARRFYEKLGYREIARLPGYYEDGADGLRLERRLD